MKTTTTTTKRSWRETLAIQVISLVILLGSAVGFGCTGTLTDRIQTGGAADDRIEQAAPVTVAVIEGASCGLEPPTPVPAPVHRNPFTSGRCTE